MTWQSPVSVVAPFMEPVAVGFIRPNTYVQQYRSKSRKRLQEIHQEPEAFNALWGKKWT